MKFYEVGDFLLTMYKEIQEEQLWEIYISNPLREGTFEEFKLNAFGDGRTKAEIEQEANEEAAKALAMLDHSFVNKYSD